MVEEGKGAPASKALEGVREAPMHSQAGTG